PLKTIWMLSEQLCGKRLKPALPRWLPHYERHRGPLSDEQREKLLRISPAQIDRLLAPARLAQPAKAKTPKPGSLLLAREIPLSVDSPRPPAGRSEEHTSELQSRENRVCRLLLEKKKVMKKKRSDVSNTNHNP